MSRRLSELKDGAELSPSMPASTAPVKWEML
jgi:hypothetical protein